MNFTQREASGKLGANPKPMPDRNYKIPTNVPGPYYVDETCIDCGMCRELAPAIFRYDETHGTSVVYHQPGSAGETALAEEALRGCPTESIGNDGEP